MSDPATILDYDDELTTDEPMITATYSSHWLPFLLAAASQLTKPSMWNPDDDVDLAVSQAKELLVRLMGADFVRTPFTGHLPFQIPAVAMYWHSGCNATKVYVHQSMYFQSFAVTDGVNDYRILTSWRAWLEQADYRLQVFHSRDYNLGKFSVACSVDASLIDKADQYAASGQLNVITEADFTIDDAQLCSFDMYRELKNPSSSGGYIGLYGIIIREKRSGE